MPVVCGLDEEVDCVVDPVTAMYIVLRKRSLPKRWKNIKKMLGIHASALCEVFYGVIESLVENNGGVLETFRSEMIRNRAVMYEKAIKRTQCTPREM